MADALQLPCVQPGSLSVSGLWRNVNVLSETLLARPPMKISVLLLSLLFVAAPFAQAGKLYFTDRGAGRVQRADLDGSNIETLVMLPGSNLRGITLNLPEGKMYFCDNGGDDIYRASLDGSDRVSIVSTSLGFPADITLDPLAQKLYWCDRNNDRIERANLDGSGRETVVETDQPYYLDLDPEGGKIYWGHFSEGSIFRANLMDGSNVETIVSGLTTVRQVRLDLGAGYIYWCDRNATPSRVQRRLIEGGPVEDLYLGLDTPHGMTLDIPAGKIYWVDTGTNNRAGSVGGRALCRGDMDGSGPVEVLINLSQPWDVVIDPRISDYGDWRKRYLPANAEFDDPEDDVDGDGIQNGIVYAMGNRLPVISTNPPGLEYAVRKNVSDLDGLRVELSTDLRTWRHNADGGSPVTADFPATGLPGDPFQFIRTEALPPFDLATQLYLRIALPSR